MRSYSPIHTIAGGIVLHPHPGRHKRRRVDVMADLDTLLSGSPAEKILVHARLASTSGLTPPQLPRLTGLPAKELEAILKDLLSKQQLIRYDTETGRMLSGQVWQQLQDDAQKLLADFHQAQPHKPGMSREEFRRRLLGDPDPKLFNRLLKKLTDDNLAVAEKDILRLPQHQVTLAADEEQLRQYLLDAYQTGGNTPPTVRELSENQNPAQLRKLLGVLCQEGLLVKIKQDLYYHQEALQNLKNQLITYLEQNEKIAAPQFKDLTGLSRKYLIPLLEYFDTAQLTMRIGDERVLRKK
jgi:selenocysteine-specific elongation factor